MSVCVFILVNYSDMNLVLRNEYYTVEKKKKDNKLKNIQ